MKTLTYALCALASLHMSNDAFAQKKGNKKQKIDPIRSETIANDGLTIMYGNAMVEKLQEEGSFESYMHLANAGQKKQFRSCAYVGDQVNFRIRASRFGLHLKYLLDNWKANRVIMAFGANEAYAGAEGVEAFERDLDSYVQIIKKRHNNSEFILASPIAAEKDSSILDFDLTKRNSDLKLYTASIKKIANKHKIKFVDLYTPSAKLFSSSDGVYTVNGQNLSDKGSTEVGRMLATAISGDKVTNISDESAAFKSVRKMVQRKAIEVAQAYHPANGISYYGLRARAYEYNYEIPHHLKLANILDQAIWKQTSNTSSTVPFPKLPIYTLKGLPNKGPKNGLGIVKSSKEDLKDFTMAEGFEINCFASSEDHPELINPLQMQFDNKGRLWVACFGSYPHPVPGTVSNDTILVFEDSNNDGKADKKTVFADGLDLPDGLVFHKEGIVVATSKKLVYLEDSDGDGKADIRKEVLRGYDNTDTHHSGYLQRSPHGGIILSEALFHRGQFETLGGVQHTKDTVIMSLDMDTRKLTVERQTEAPNPWKVTYNKWGESIQFFGGGQIIDADLYNMANPVGSVPPLSLGAPFRYDKGVSATFVDSPNFPKKWEGGLLTTHLLTKNEINFTALKLVNGTYKADGAKTTLVKSSNKVFRPSDVVFGHDGALYVSDFYYPIIGHAQHSIRHKDRDYANGRIWRISYKKGKTLDPKDMGSLSSAELINALKDPFLSIRQAARNELDSRPNPEVNKLLSQAVSTHKKEDIFALELLWLMERQKDFSDTSLIKRLVKSSDVKIRRSATRSLRYWTDALGSDLEPILTTLASDEDERVKIGLVTVISHIQKDDAKWSTIGELIVTKPKTPLVTMKSMLPWKDHPGIAPEFPVLTIENGSYIPDSIWTVEEKGLKGHLYFTSDSEQSLILGHENNPFLNITVNETPLLISSGSPHSKESQNSFLVKKGINKVEYYFKSMKEFKNKRSGKFKIYISDSVGNQPQEIKLVQKNELSSIAKKYKEAQLANWKEFAFKTFKQNCANCHSLDARAVGPALTGLLGKKQTVISKDGSKREVIIDENYLRNAIKDPQSEYPEGFAPVMVPQPLNDTEVDSLVKWLMQLK